METRSGNNQPEWPTFLLGALLIRTNFAVAAKCHGRRAQHGRKHSTKSGARLQAAHTHTYTHTAVRLCVVVVNQINRRDPLSQRRPQIGRSKTTPPSSPKDKHTFCCAKVDKNVSTCSHTHTHTQPHRHRHTRHSHKCAHALTEYR